VEGGGEKFRRNTSMELFRCKNPTKRSVMDDRERVAGGGGGGEEF